MTKCALSPSRMAKVAALVELNQAKPKGSGEKVAAKHRRGRNGEDTAYHHIARMISRHAATDDAIRFDYELRECRLETVSSIERHPVPCMPRFESKKPTHTGPTEDALKKIFVSHRRRRGRQPTTTFILQQVRHAHFLTAARPHPSLTLFREEDGYRRVWSIFSLSSIIQVVQRSYRVALSHSLATSD